MSCSTLAGATLPHAYMLWRWTVRRAIYVTSASITGVGKHWTYLRMPFEVLASLGYSPCRFSASLSGSTQPLYAAFSGPECLLRANDATRIRYRATPILRRQFADFLDRAKDVVRYFKNERFGFSVTYYESNRPRQYFPDFIVFARDHDGRDVTWIAETKGEIRPNTALKSEAARLWCERMSQTAYGNWRFLFIPQRDFEKTGLASTETLAELAKRLSH